MCYVTLSIIFEIQFYNFDNEYRNIKQLRSWLVYSGQLLQKTGHGQHPKLYTLHKLLTQWNTTYDLSVNPFA